MRVFKRKALSDAEIDDLEDFLEGFSTSCEDDLHPDRVGISRRPEPKSIYSAAPRGSIGSIPKPKMSSKPKGPGNGPPKLWKGNDHKALDPYLYRNAGTLQRRR